MTAFRSFAAGLAATSLLALAGQAFATNYFVNKANPTPGAGTDWPSAFLTVQEALAEAALTQGPHLIRIAAGTYYVDEGLPGAATRESTFFIPAGTTIRAGYAPTGEPEDTERNPLRYPVILSADLDRNDNYLNPGFEAGDYSSLASNSYHCIVVDDEAIREDTLISGVTVEGGNADGGFEKGNGGGIHCGDGTPFIRNCIIRYCRAKMTNSPASLFLAFDGLGGGLYSRDTYDGGLLEIRDTRFEHCHAMWGGGPYKKPTVHEAPTNSILLAGCRFIENRADRVTGGTARGGGAALDHGIGRIDLVNTEFSSNRCDNDGDETFSGAGAALHIGLPTQDEDCLYGCASGCGGYDECTEGCIGSGGTCPDMSCEDCATTPC